MVREGYAAVTTRRVALEAGIKAPLVHYYFPTTDDLLLAMYRRSAERSHDATMEALKSCRPLEALWRLGDDADYARLGMEVIALANHRQSLREEIVQTAEAYRVIQTEALSKALERELGGALGPVLREAGAGPTGLIVLIAGLARTLATEGAIGVSTGHAEARALIDWLLRRAEPS